MIEKHSLFCVKFEKYYIFLIIRRIQNTHNFKETEVAPCMRVIQ